MKIIDILNAIDSLAPFKTQEKWDNSGLLIGNPNNAVTKAMLALDVTFDVIEDAKKNKSNLIITHHPVIFEPLKNIMSNSVVYELIKNDISVISAHTNLDVAEFGVNYQLAKKLNLKNCKPLDILNNQPFYTITVFVPVDYSNIVKDKMCDAGGGNLGNYSNCTFSVLGKGSFKADDKANPFIGNKNEQTHVDECEISLICPPQKVNSVINAMKSVHPYEVPAYNIFENHAVSSKTSLGIIGEISEITAEEFAVNVKKALNTRCVAITNKDKIIKNIAVCGGSGADEMYTAIAKGADALVTGDVKHNYFVEAQNSGFVLIDAGHFATENTVLYPLSEYLTESCHNEVEFLVSQQNTNPALYI